MVVAVIDSGVDDVYGADFTGETANGDPKDDNGIGIKGVAHNVKVMNVKAAQYSGVLTSGAIVDAVNYAVANSADVINMSFGGSTYSKMVEEALANAYSSAVLVASAGNAGSGNDPVCSDSYARNYPASFNWVIGVMAKSETASGNGEYLSTFSNWDCVATDGFEYEIMVPGSDILSTIPNNGYAKWDGTSMAAPMVSAVAALARSKWKNKENYSSRFISGQLVATGDSQMGIVDENNVAHAYQTLNALKALSSAPLPSLSFHSYQLFDDVSIDAENDNDGRADSGELINLGIVVHNHWGKASNVEVKLTAQTPLGETSEYVEMTIDKVNYGDVGSFANDDIGLQVEDGEITGVTMPFQLRLKADTQIQFHSSQSGDGQGDDLPPKLSVRGNLIVQGTEDQPVELFPSQLKAAWEVNVESLKGGNIQMDYVNIMNPILTHSEGAFTINHGFLTQHGYDGIAYFDKGIGDEFVKAAQLDIDRLGNSRVSWLGTRYDSAEQFMININTDSVNQSLIEHSALQNWNTNQLNNSDCAVSAEPATTWSVDICRHAIHFNE